MIIWPQLFGIYHFRISERSFFWKSYIPTKMCKRKELRFWSQLLVLCGDALFLFLQMQLQSLIKSRKLSPTSRRSCHAVSNAPPVCAVSASHSKHLCSLVQPGASFLNIEFASIRKSPFATSVFAGENLRRVPEPLQILTCELSQNHWQLFKKLRKHSQTLCKSVLTCEHK